MITWNNYWPCDWEYTTKLPISTCVERIIQVPWTFGDDLTFNPGSYTCDVISDSRLLLMFKGFRYGGYNRTIYCVDFVQEDHCTLVKLIFQREILGLMPLTATQTLDKFMFQKIEATRKPCSKV